MTTKPVPSITTMNRPYWEGTANGELRLLHCQLCDGLARFAQEWCPHCWSVDLDWRLSAGRGTVTNLSVVDYAPYPAFDDMIPYVLALIELDEGVRMMSNIIGCPAHEARIGMRVKVTFVPRGDIMLPMFEPDNQPTAA